LISWNVNGRVGSACSSQLEVVLERRPHVVALQELTLVSYSQWRDALIRAGFSIVSSVDLVRLPYPPVEPPIRRRYFNAIAARGAVTALPGLSFPNPLEGQVAFPEKYVAARIELDGLELEVHNAHLPPGSTRGAIKPQAFRAIRRRTDAVRVPHVLCGDFNTPKHEDATSVTTWAPRGDRKWDAAERRVLVNPNLRDVYRQRLPPGTRPAASHYTGKTARRYDHIYASAELIVTACVYHEAWLTMYRLSDHAAVEADLELAA
jgi:endonuclease/exonuclease/phosphatase family metal-dependent hydrolase